MMSPQEELLDIARRYYAWKATLSPTTLAMMNAVPDKLIREIVHDNRRSFRVPRSMAETPDAPPPEPMNRPSVVEPLSLKVPGIALVDQLCDAQDERDRQELRERFRVK